VLDFFFKKIVIITIEPLNCR